MSLALVTLFTLFLAVSAWSGSLSLLVPACYLGASMAAGAAYALDKSAAQEGRWRTRESTLHLLALLGGWPGALVAQKLLRHKSRKRRFQFVFWITVALNCCALMSLAGLWSLDR